MGDISVPITSAWGFSSAKSMAQMPVPVPMSRTLQTVFFSSGARKSLPSRERVSRWWMMSSDSFCLSSLAAQYWVLLLLSEWYLLPLMVL